MPVDLATLLVEEGTVAPEAMERALARQREAGGALDTALLELGLVEEGVLLDALARAANLPPAPESAFTAVDPRARRVFPSKVAERHGLLPFALEGRELHLVATWPVDLALLDELSFMLSLNLVPYVGPEWRVRAAVTRLYGTPLDPRLAALGAGGGLPAEAGEPPSPPDAAPLAPSAVPAEWGEQEGERGDADARDAAPGFERDLAEPIEPLAAALAQAVEAAELPFVHEEPGAEPLLELGSPRWTLDEARAALAAARTRDEVVRVALRHLRDSFEYAALFAVTRDAVAGHDALGPEEDARDRCRGTAIYVSDPGVFRTAIELQSPYLGPVDPEAAGNAAILGGLGRGTPHTVFVFPVILRGRPVCILYADNGEAPVSPTKMGDLVLFLGNLGAAFERILLERKARHEAKRAATPPPDEGGWHAPEPVRSEPEPPPPPPPPVEIEVEVDADELVADPAPAAATGRPTTPSGAAVAPVAGAMAPEPEPQSPPDDPLARLRASAPGTDARRDALAAVFALLGDPDAATRRAAVEALAEVGDPASFLPLAERVFDADGGVADAARDALARHRREPGMRPVPEKLRRALLSGLSDRAIAAARALGALRDVESIAGLIQTLEVSGPGPADAAADALAAITMQRLGTDARRWLQWWKGNRGRGRAEWLFTALLSEDRAVRAAAAKELAEVAPPPEGYDVDLAPEDRERVARAWASAWAKSGRVI